MGCKHSSQNNGNKIRCDINGFCFYQYYCGSERCYKSTAAPQKCNKYEKSDCKMDDIAKK